LLADERDVAGLVELVRTIWRISQAEPLRDILRPAMIDDWVESDDDRVERFVRETVEVYNHPVATCRMGRGKLAVVDPQGRVHGVGGLRVIDASIIPVALTAQTNLATMMIAEKLAETV
jgi:choline dehydrogenase